MLNPVRFSKFHSPLFSIWIIFLCLPIISCNYQTKQSPDSQSPLPTIAQLKWHETEFYGFLHFGLNTFTDQEWGYGDVGPENFNPTDFDADQIVAVAKEAGMKGLILTCKHHDGFCLWPSVYTEYSVKNSPWKDGKGDVVKEIADACARHGLKFGVYLSPWDRNHADYGKPEYIEFYRNQLKELLKNYGSIFEVWFDGANGGTGWYGGANEERKIDRSTYYDWETTWAIVRELQPEAMIFSDVGPDVRWVGNENGIAGDPCWATYTPKGINEAKPAPGQVEYQLGQNGQRDGKYWLPAECDVSIRPGWFYHQSQDSMVKSPEVLLDLYFKSVGRGTSFLLNIPPDQRGRIPEPDVQSLLKFKELRELIFNNNLAQSAKITLSNIQNKREECSPINLIDDDRNTYYLSESNSLRLEIILEFDKMIVFNIISLQEYLPLGQRVDLWLAERLENDLWQEFARGTSIGNKRLWEGMSVTTSKVKITLIGSKTVPAISELGLYFYNEKAN